MAKLKRRYQCPDRCADPNCHDTCKRHQEEREELAKINTERQKDVTFIDAKIRAEQNTMKLMKQGRLKKRKKK
jgi:hypothetical protein